jgi:hypothetical protein
LNAVVFALAAACSLKGEDGINWGFENMVSGIRQRIFAHFLKE